MNSESMPANSLSTKGGLHNGTDFGLLEQRTLSFQFCIDVSKRVPREVRCFLNKEVGEQLWSRVSSSPSSHNIASRSVSDTGNNQVNDAMTIRCGEKLCVP